MKNIARTWMRNLNTLRQDERGAESSEVILVIALLVIAMTGAWFAFKGKLEDVLGRSGNCIDNTATSQDNGTSQGC